MQALFRNPIVEPGLVGTSSGAAFDAALYFVLGAAFKFHAGPWTLPLAACVGGMIATWLVVTLSRSAEGARSSVIALAMRFFDVWDWADRDYLTLSGGERQRVHFARVLSQVWYPTPGALRYLVLDEPLTFLDIRYQYDFMHRVRELMAPGDLVVVGIVHDLNLAARFADHLVMMRKGRVLAAAAPEEVLQPALVQEAFGILPQVRHDDADGRMHLVFG